MIPVTTRPEEAPSDPPFRASPTLRVALAYASAALVLLLTRYAPSFSPLGPTAALFAWLAFVTAVTALLPTAVVVLALRRPLSACGLTWGRARRDLRWIAAALVAAVALAALVSRAPEVHAFYPRFQIVKAAPLWWIPTTLAFAAYGLSWELLFRGYLLLALTDRLGPWSILLQTIPFALAHVDKPPLELWLSIPAALAFGVAAYRTRSILPGFLVHVTLSTSVNLFCAHG